MAASSRTRLPLWVRRTHKWLSLVVGIQALLWVLGGLYMVAVPIEVVRGEHLVRSERPALATDTPRINPDALAARYPGLTGFAFKQLGGREVVEISQGKRLVLADAASGAPLGPVPREQIAALAAAAYTGSGRIRAIDWLATAPREAGGRPAPLWAVHFDDAVSTTLYYSPDTGELVTRRHALWRLFDFAWMLHIMDYEEREDVNNWLLRFSAIVGFAMTLSGVWLLVLWLHRKVKR